jgi:hypothetical protein
VRSRPCSALAALWLSGCATPAPGSAPAGVPPALVPFLGEHRGGLRLIGDAAVREVPMGLTVATLADAPGALRWAIHYGAGSEAQTRDYRLLVVDAAAGHYRIDERNGIVLDARLVDDELVSVFAAGGQILVARYRAVPDGVWFALESFAADGAVPAGGAEAGGVPVSSWRDFTRQRARLRRQPAPGG